MAVEAGALSPLAWQEVCSQYVKVRDRFDQKERIVFASVKRLFEAHHGDNDFRAALASGCNDQEVLDDRGIHLSASVAHRIIKSPKSSGESLADLPEAKIWNSYSTAMLELRVALLRAGFTGDPESPFDTWRSRQMARVSLDLGPSGGGIVHPAVAIELTSGCSVGCWFCGISADKLRGIADFESFGDLFAQIIDVLGSRLGNAAGSGFLYWASEPLDNPDYLKYLDVFYQKLGLYPQTTTAVPLRDVQLTKEVLRRQTIMSAAPSRFSILTKRQLREVHSTFTALELADVELVLQNNENVSTRKASGGRAFDKTTGLGRDGSIPGTIACVSGYLVNLRERRVRLVAPCSPSKEWPDGYITLATSTFHDAANFAEILDKWTLDNMKVKLDLDDQLCLAPNFTLTEDVGMGGLAIGSPSSRCTSLNFPSLRFNGLAPVWPSTPRKILNEANRVGTPIGPVVAALEELTALGVLERATQAA